MKKALFCWILFAGIFAVNAYDTETVSLSNLQNGTQWKERVIFDLELPDGSQQPDPVGITYTMQGDTTIDGVLRRKLYYSLWTEQTAELIGFIHLAGNKMYFRAAEGVNLQDKYIMLCVNQNPEQEDVLLYDFTLETNSAYHDCEGDYILSDIQSVAVGNSHRKKYCFSSTFYPSLQKYWIEGMGSTLNLFEPVSEAIADAYFKTLVCFSQNSEVLWMNPDYQDCNGSTAIEPVDKSSSGIQINPVNEKSWLISSVSPMREICVYDAKGMLLLKQDTPPDCLRYTLNGQSLEPGIYLVNVLLQNTFSGQKKLIVK
jgi:hypothetical protein